MVGCPISIKKREPEWLNTMLHIKFFDVCVDHWNLRKNEKNVFCIDCNLCVCKHCITSSSSAHGVHRWLQICKYVYHDVVRLQDIQKYLDCSQIQTYKINGEKAVHLNTRPQSKDTKPSTKSKSGAACEACGRKQELPNLFCSIACKVSRVEEVPKDESQEKIMSIPVSESDDLNLKEKDDQESDINKNESALSFAASSAEYQQASVSSTLKPKKRLNKRKGIPHRAPFF